MNLHRWQKKIKLPPMQLVLPKFQLWSLLFSLSILTKIVKQILGSFSSLLSLRITLKLKATCQNEWSSGRSSGAIRLEWSWRRYWWQYDHRGAGFLRHRRPSPSPPHNFPLIYPTSYPILSYFFCSEGFITVFVLSCLVNGKTLPKIKTTLTQSNWTHFPTCTCNSISFDTLWDKLITVEINEFELCRFLAAEC